MARTPQRANTPSNSDYQKSSTVKLKDPEPLTDGSTPTFSNWRIQLEDKFLINASIFDLEEAKIAYVFNRTANIA